MYHCMLVKYPPMPKVKRTAPTESASRYWVHTCRFPSLSKVRALPLETGPHLVPATPPSTLQLTWKTGVTITTPPADIKHRHYHNYTPSWHQTQVILLLHPQLTSNTGITITTPPTDIKHRYHYYTLSWHQTQVLPWLHTQLTSNTGVTITTPPADSKHRCYHYYTQTDVKQVSP